MQLCGTRMRSDARNPFRYGALALDEAFTDREEELAELTADVRNGQDVVVFAPRRYGKSSLIWRASQSLIAEGVLVGHVDLMTTPTKGRLAEKLARTIHEDIASPLYRARERLADLPRPPHRTRDHRQPGRRLAELQLRCGASPRGRRCDPRAPAAASRHAGCRARAPRRDRPRRVSGDRRDRPQLAEAHALRLSGAARGRPRVSRQQAAHDAADLQRRERAVLEKRQADGTGHDPRRRVRRLHRRPFLGDGTDGRSEGDRPRARDHVGPSVRDPGALLLPLGRDACRR